MQHPPKPSRISIILAFAAVYIIWGSTYLGIKYAIQTMPPLLMSGVRYFIAGLIVFVIAISTGAPFPKKIHWRNTLIIGALLVLMGNGGVALGESLIPSGIASLIVCSVPMWFALFGWLFFNKGRPGTLTVTGIILGFVGMTILVGPKNILHVGQGINLTGVLIITVGSMGWSIGSLYVSKAKLPENQLITIGMQMLCGGFLLFMSGLVKGEYSQVLFNAISTSSLLAMGYLITFGSIVAFSAYSWLLRVVPPSLVSTYAYVNPVIAVFLGWMFLNEPIDKYTIIGSIFIVFCLDSYHHTKAAGKRRGS